MYEHPYLAYTVSEHDQEQIRQAADRRFFLEEHADQIVPRAAGPIRRLGQRMRRALTGARGTDTGAGARSVALGARSADMRGPDASAAAVRRPPAGCEPAPIR
ncbi:hypothetical protein [Microbacterium sp. UFMG61]|uniref:hypothetical protein n=1 Tax=Microbacterium sp. UFMG61 TaxID=2745935 RepID=UPI00188F01A9|nr:hypothetical protein [Microbacterium sp. UFMG61]